MRSLLGRTCRPHEILTKFSTRALPATQEESAKCRMLSEKCPWGRRKNNCHRTDVEHVFNVLGTMELCPTYFCVGP